MRIEQDLPSSIDLNPAVGDLGLPERYEISEMIGRGGMGCIYKALDRELNQWVAIKLMHEDMCTTPEGKQLFLREARALASMRHPNIIGIRHLGISSHGRPFQVVDLLHGETLADRLQKNGPLSISDFRHIFGQIADALDYSSMCSIVHRDIKPSNIFLCEQEREAEGRAQAKAVLLDFGIAKIIQQNDDPEQTVTSTAFIVGSPRYMSPEQCKGDRVDARSDMYSLGCVMYEALTGQPPFAGDTHMETMYMHMNNAPPPLYAVTAPGTQPNTTDVGNIVLQCLKKDPEERPANFSDLKQRLLGARDLTGCIFVASPPEPTAPIANKKLRAITSVAVICALSMLGGALIWKHQQETVSFDGAHSPSEILQKLEERTRHNMERFPGAKGADRESLAEVLREDLTTLARQYAVSNRIPEAETAMRQIFTVVAGMPDEPYRRVRIWQQLYDAQVMHMHRVSAEERAVRFKKADQYIKNAIAESEKNDLSHVACESRLKRVQLFCIAGRARESAGDFQLFMDLLREMDGPMDVSLPKSMRSQDRRLDLPKRFIEECLMYARVGQPEDMLVLCDYFITLSTYFVSIDRLEPVTITLQRAKEFLAIAYVNKPQDYQSEVRMMRINKLEQLVQNRLAQEKAERKKHFTRSRS